MDPVHATVGSSEVPRGDTGSVAVPPPHMPALGFLGLPPKPQAGLPSMGAFRAPIP